VLKRLQELEDKKNDPNAPIDVEAEEVTGT
jgi:hypothetical protein